MSIGHSPHVPQYTPDQPKPQQEVTAEERKEANIKIGGSTTPALTPTLEVTGFP
jgi:phosphatidylserine decarboxylase